MLIINNNGKEREREWQNLTETSKLVRIAQFVFQQ